MALPLSTIHVRKTRVGPALDAFIWITGPVDGMLLLVSESPIRLMPVVFAGKATSATTTHTPAPRFTCPRLLFVVLATLVASNELVTVSGSPILMSLPTLSLGSSTVSAEPIFDPDVASFITVFALPGESSRYIVMLVAVSTSCAV